MSTQPDQPEAEHPGRYSHEALLYPGDGQFLSGVLSFVRPAVDAGFPVLVLLTAARIAAVRGALGPAAEKVEFADMAEVGGNPGRIIGAWRRFLDAHGGAAELRGVGEAVFPGRSPAELAECVRYEELLNVAFDPATPLRVLCPYDVAALPAPVIADARRTHPYLTGGIPGDRQRSAGFRPADLAEPYTKRLPARPADAACITFERGGLGGLRSFVTAQAERAGLASRPATALVAAVNEIATNSLQHGGGRGELRVWTDDGWLLCEVSDQGHLTAPLAGQLPPAADQGAGLWLANQLTDLVQIHSSTGGTVVRVHQKL
ncbi:MAG TPA: sensor histidine kinase [Streptosporangiaceae bacterium]|nr:sensor histidine kinase [Streptosporangiaceae bacterium]